MIAHAKIDITRLSTYFGHWTTQFSAAFSIYMEGKLSAMHEIVSHHCPSEPRIINSKLGSRM